MRACGWASDLIAQTWIFHSHYRFAHFVRQSKNTHSTFIPAGCYMPRQIIKTTISYWLIMCIDGNTCNWSQMAIGKHCTLQFLIWCNIQYRSLQYSTSQFHCTLHHIALLHIAAQYFKNVFFTSDKDLFTHPVERQGNSTDKTPAQVHAIVIYWCVSNQSPNLQP